MPEPTMERERVDAWIGSSPAHSLLPPRRPSHEATAPALPRDVLWLGPDIGLAVAAVDQGYLIVPIASSGGLRRAVAGDGVHAAMLLAMRERIVMGAFRGEAFGVTQGSAGDHEVAIDVDQSNESVVVGSAVVKLYPMTRAGHQPGLDLPLHLAEVGFGECPAPLGALWWRSPEGDDVLLGTAAAFLPGARDGWAWYLERVLRLVGDDADGPGAREPAAAMGRLTAHMHLALATASPVLPSPIAAADETSASAWRRGAVCTADEAVALTEGEAGRRLLERRTAIGAELDRLADAAGTTVIRVHGDFHVGQVLEWSGGHAVTDFDGNPTADPTARAAMDTPVRDVASFVRSIDHLGRIAEQRRPGREEAIGRWIAASREGFLDAYVRELDVAGDSGLFDDRWLRPLEVAQACSEYVYAARFLPRWLDVADRAMRALIPDARR